MSIIYRRNKGSIVTPDEVDENFRLVSEPREEDSKIIKLDNAAGGYMHAGKDASGKYNVPLTGSLTVDLKNVKNNGWASILMNITSNPLIALTNNNDASVLVFKDTVVTHGVYEIFIRKAYKSVIVYIPDAKSGGTTPPSGNSPLAPSIGTITEYTITVSGTPPLSPSIGAIVEYII